MKANIKQLFGGPEALANYLWRTVIDHSRKGHKLRLAVEDDEQTIWCIYCGVPIVTGSDAVVNRCGEKMTAAGIEFEVLCSTGQNHQ